MLGLDRPSGRYVHDAYLQIRDFTPPTLPLLGQSWTDDGPSTTPTGWGKLDYAR